ncbi:hypothetical protein LY76DRAFT_382619 [Colletotrichum caudatum]|nr:hypothetical protein LY76DRAFT_382619 [Colletotrichum caudatum]
MQPPSPWATSELGICVSEPREARRIQLDISPTRQIPFLHRPLDHDEGSSPFRQVRKPCFRYIVRGPRRPPHNVVILCGRNPPDENQTPSLRLRAPRSAPGVVDRPTTPPKFLPSSTASVYSFSSSVLCPVLCSSVTGKLSGVPLRNRSGVPRSNGSRPGSP